MAWKQVLGAALWIVVNGCGGPNCSGMSMGEKRDWCFFERAQDAARDDDLQAALEATREIRSALPRSAAVDAVLTAKPTGLDAPRVQGLCQSLPMNHADACRRTWQRPHLWDH